MNYLPALACICAAILLLLIAMCAPRVARYLGAIPSRIREHDARARANRRRREIDNAHWRGIERHADHMANMHCRTRGAL